MKIHNKLLLCALVLLLGLGAVATPAEAQDWSGRGRLQGIVTTEDGQPIEGASVALYYRADKTKGPKPVTTDKKGRWSILGLRNGPWTVFITRDTFVPSEGQVNVSEVQVNETIKVNLQRIEDTEEAKRVKGVVTDFDKANTAMREGRWAEARELYEKVLPEVKDDSRANVIFAIAQTYFQERNWPAAMPKLEEYLALKPADATALKLLAAAQGQSGNAEGALVTLKKFVEVNPEDVDALQLIVNLLIQSGREAEADEYAKRMPAGAALDPSALLNKGIEKYNANDLDGALVYFDKAVAANSKMAEVYYYRGLAYLAKGMMAEAKADLQKCIDTDPNNAKAADAREFLKDL